MDAVEQMLQRTRFISLFLQKGCPLPRLRATPRNELILSPTGFMATRTGSHPQTEGLRNAYPLFLDGVRSGLMAHSARAKSHGVKTAFCMPDDFAITIEQDCAFGESVFVDDGARLQNRLSPTNVYKRLIDHRAASPIQ